MYNKDFVTWQMGEIKNAAVKAGIGHALFICFGTALGFVRDNQVIEYDDDTDFGVMSDWTTEKQDWAFHDNLQKAGLFEARKRLVYRKHDNRIVWMSLKAEPENGKLKSCIWHMWTYKDMMWHSKDGVCRGGLGHQSWVHKVGFKRKLPVDAKTEAVAKGIPAKYFERLIEVPFMGNTYNVPYMYGSCCDAWYNSWLIPKKGGASHAEKHLIIQKWDNQKTWKMV